MPMIEYVTARDDMKILSKITLSRIQELSTVVSKPLYALRNKLAHDEHCDHKL
jgi:hypothetical protein